MRIRNFLKAMSLVLTTSIVLGMAGAAGRVEAATGITLSGTSSVQKYGVINGNWDSSSATLTLKGRANPDDPYRNIEAINVNIDNTTGYAGSLQYSVYVESKGWQDYTAAGNEAGLKNKALRIEALKMELTGALASRYRVEYAVRMEKDSKFQGFVSDGAVAGTIGDTKRIEEIKIRVVEVTTGDTPGVNYRVHRESSGWGSKWAQNGAVAGEAGKGKQIDGIELNLSGFKGGIKYRSKVQGTGLENNWSSNGETSGTQGRRTESIAIDLTGDVSQTYDVYYRVCVQSVGWLGWAKNGVEAGIKDETDQEKTNLTYKLEAIQVVLVKKSGSAPGKIDGIESIGKLTVINSQTPLLPGRGLFEMPANALVSYAVKTADGWSAIKSDGQVLNVTGPITGLAVSSQIPADNKKLYLQVDMPDFGKPKTDSNQSYDTGFDLKIVDAGKRIENVRMALYGGSYSCDDDTDQEYYVYEHWWEPDLYAYSIYYRVKTSKYGWMAWTKDGIRCGTDEIGNTISAIQIVVLPKDQTPENTYLGVTSDSDKSLLRMKDFPKQKIVTTNNAFAKWCLKNFPENQKATNYINSNYHKSGYRYYQIAATWPYKLGGKTKKNCDCTGFVVWVFDKYFHKKVTFNSHSVAFKTGKVISYKNIKPGDLLCDCTTYHGDVFFYCGKDEYGHDIIFDGMTPKVNGKIKYVVPCFRYIDLADWASKSKHYVKRK